MQEPLDYRNILDDCALVMSSVGEHFVTTTTSYVLLKKRPRRGAGHDEAEAHRRRSEPVPVRNLNTIRR